ncbi:hypothetical protein GOP47_0001350 [Adiantum capillus-veneris]|uniref:Uncharacterized protein n=1 Tax=Adiantum capillus-veneris TaxID=13818 RepID=A0A9D4ZPX9_ADICA|nr:hypothetical protein GOP47_0001350 [Adiantum capillus-veneris]
MAVMPDYDISLCIHTYINMYMRPSTFIFKASTVEASAALSTCASARYDALLSKICIEFGRRQRAVKQGRRQQRHGRTHALKQLEEGTFNGGCSLWAATLPYGRLCHSIMGRKVARIQLEWLAESVEAVSCKRRLQREAPCTKQQLFLSGSHACIAPLCPGPGVT